MIHTIKIGGRNCGKTFKHTNETLAKLSELEINILVSKILNKYTEIPENAERLIIGDVEHHRKSIDELWSCHLDYCNDLAAIIPIEIDNGISLHKYVSQAGWQAFRKMVGFEISCDNINPYRALAECFILMNQVEK